MLKSLPAEVNGFHKLKCGQIYYVGPTVYEVACCLCGVKVQFDKFPEHFQKFHLSQDSQLCKAVPVPLPTKTNDNEDFSIKCEEEEFQLTPDPDESLVKRNSKLLETHYTHIESEVMSLAAKDVAMKKHNAAPAQLRPYLINAAASNEMMETSMDEPTCNYTDRFDRLENKTDTLTGMLSKILSYHENFVITQKGENSHSASRMTAQEDFSTVQTIHCRNAQELVSLEEQLEESEFFFKFYRYIKSEYDLNGKRDGGMVFRTIIRRFVDASVFLQYSWKGQRPRTEQNSNNVSFQKCFPNFIRLIHQVCSAADNSFSTENTQQEFSKALRYKHKLMQRFGEHKKGITPRKSSSRGSNAILKKSIAVNSLNN